MRAKTFLYLTTAITVSLWVSLVCLFEFPSTRATSTFSPIMPAPPQVAPLNTKFAYAMLIAGVSSSGSYRGYLYNALVSSLALRRSAPPPVDFDFVVLIMFDSNANTDLPQDELDMLAAANIKIKIVKPFFGAPSFYTAMMAKFYCWEMTDYSKVIFLDGDVLPLTDLSPFATLPTRPNLAVAWKVSPVHGGERASL